MTKNSNKGFFTATLLGWNRDINSRQMPWKGEKDPYKIWLSEIILQQTRVEQGWEYYLRFIKKFPTVNKLAAAKEEDVFKLWEGLGYYSRCRNLLASARFIHHELKGKFPGTYNDILQLKGVGPYTAAAIASFAFNLPFAVVDGNVNRVLARYFGIETAIDSTEGKKIFSVLAQELLSSKEPGLYNQAIMDFGATVCKPQLPLCIECPLSKNCSACNTGKVGLLPLKDKKIIKRNRWFNYIVLEKDGSYFIRTRRAKDIWQNLNEFVLVEWPEKIGIKELLQTKEFKSMVPAKIQWLPDSKEYKQQLTHQVIHAVFIEGKLLSGPAPKGYEPVERKNIKRRAFPGLLNHFLADKGWK
jgi:A/G-specific adenine glycosylase